MSSADALAEDPALAAVPSEVRQALVSGAIDPERHAWSRSAARGLVLALAAGATAVGLANDEVVEMADRRGERFGLVPVAFRPAGSPLGSSEDVERLLRGLDRVFDHRVYVVALRRPVPAGLDTSPICSAVQLWLAQLDASPGERHATYEDGDVSIDLTLVEPAPRAPRGGRLFTIGPMEVMEQLGKLDRELVDAASRCEESLGALPLVAAVAYDPPWRVPRGFVQQLLYGTPDLVRTGGGYEAEFTANGRSLFSDAGARAVSALWFVGPGEHRVYDNPWAERPPQLAVPAPRFSPVDEPDRRGRVVLRWHPGGRGGAPA